MTNDKLKNCPFCKSNMEWIKISDREPKLNQRVLATDGDEIYVCAGGYGGWWRSYFYDEHITHWMPLPELPKDTADKGEELDYDTSNSKIS